MTLQELVAEIPHLTVSERQALLIAVQRSLDERNSIPTAKEGGIVARLYGALRGDGPALTDSDVARIRDEALREKYS